MPLPLLPDLPILAVLPALKRALSHGSAVLTAPPGSGKTTLVPLALLDEPWLAGRNILLLEPRRLAARTAAARMAALLAEPVGVTVGYQIRFDRRISQATRVEVLTEGILTRRLLADPELNDVGLIIFDEFHERSLHADLALALCLDLQQLKEDLRFLVMSATLDTEPLAALLGGVEVVRGDGISHPVRIDYLASEPAGPLGSVMAGAIRRVLAEQSGDCLVFLPGAGEIREVQRLLKNEPACRNLRIAPLYGDLPQTAQDRALLPDPQTRRLILATSIAETSLTIEGVSTVIDGGWSRRPRFDPATGLTRLATVRVSRSSARQRAGRAGRLGPGYCLRLWTRGLHQTLLPFHPPEIVEADLSGAVLDLAAWGCIDPLELTWLDPPRSGQLKQAVSLLKSLGALDASGRITPSGRAMSRLPLHPRLGHLLLFARVKGQVDLGCDLAALLSERDPLRNEQPLSTEIGLRLRLLDAWRHRQGKAAREQGGDQALLGRMDRAARQYRKMLASPSEPQDQDQAGLLLAAAYPDRIARRTEHGRYRLSSGRAVLLPPADPLLMSEYLVIAELDAGQRQGRAFLAEGVRMDEIRAHLPQLFRKSDEIVWDSAEGRVSACTRLLLGELCVAEQPMRDPDPARIGKAMIEGIQAMGIDCLAWDHEARQLQARITNLAAWRPEERLPDVSDQGLMADLDWLEPFLAGISRAAQLKGIDLTTVFRSLLSREQLLLLEREAPAALTVPSGSRVRIEYRMDGPPILAVRLQELFGLARTPAVCGGRVPLLLHLLSPARRPIQITSDLAGFWQRAYPEVKKELRGRYPKHAWPDDPLTAQPLRGVPRKKAG